LIFEAINKWLEGKKKDKWAEVMLKVVRSHTTSVSRATNFTLFKLLFGAETVMPEEIKHENAWTMEDAIFCPTKEEAKDLLESDRIKAIDNLQKYQTKMKYWRDKKVKEKTFDIGDLVLLWSPHTKSLVQLQPKWDEPYVVVER
jgi:hypothetical protein